MREGANGENPQAKKVPTEPGGREPKKEAKLVRKKVGGGNSSQSVASTPALNG